jgi:hypothetical protein
LNYVPEKKIEIQVLMELPQARSYGAEGSYDFIIILLFFEKENQ